MKYTIVKSRFGTYTSVAEDGTKLTTGLTEEAVRICTDEIRIPVIEGTFTGYTSGARSGVVEGKL